MEREREREGGREGVIGKKKKTQKNPSYPYPTSSHSLNTQLL
jgi:hypothetical protein